MGEKFFELNIAQVSNKEYREGNISGFNVKEVIEDSIASSDQNLVNTNKKKSTFCDYWGWNIGFFLSIAVGYACWHLDPLTWAVSKRLAVTENSRMFDVWQSEPVATRMNLYVFNYTNIERFDSGLDKKLKLQELGPYAYKIETERVNITFHNNDTVSYKEKKLYTFLPEASKGSPTDNITVPNVPYMSVMDKIKDKSMYMVQMPAGAALSGIGAEPFLTVSVNDLLWGYDDTIFKYGTLFVKYTESLTIPFEKFGLFCGKNGTQLDNYTMYTGEEDIMKAGKMYMVNGEKTLSHWGASTCNSLDGSPGPIIPPFLDESVLYLYTKDACRRIPFHYRGKMSIEGVNTNYYVVPDDVFSNSGENECFCTNECLPNGVLNTSACAYGAPVLQSLPHFLHGTPELYSLLDGIKPDRSLHESYINIEPNLGIIMKGSSSMQMNVVLRNLKWVTPLSPRFPKTMILPMIWLQLATDTFPSEIMFEIKASVLLYYVTYVVLFYVPFVIAAMCLFVAIYKKCVDRTRRKEKNPEMVGGRIATNFDEQFVDK